ncbi:MAG: formate dehydrogenase accessory sulfurtransferase FdhD [Bacteroidota bacterium]
MTKASVQHVYIEKIEGEEKSYKADLVACEEPLEIRLGFGSAHNRMQKSISVTMRTPGNDFELAAGFLYTEGIIQHASDINTIKYCTEANTIENKENIVRVELNENVNLDFTKLQRNFYTTSSCGVCGKESTDAVKTVCPFPLQKHELKIQKNTILQLPEILRKQQSVFEYTGGIHAAALFNAQGELLLLREDVGRHNAVDKIAGAVLSGNTLIEMPLRNFILLLSGRASFELMQKAVMCGIGLVCAVGAPSSLAVEMAKESGITLIGFLRPNRFNIYCNSEIISDL